jgi:hypothetical protein
VSLRNINALAPRGRIIMSNTGIIRRRQVLPEIPDLPFEL